jgi:hypothetical protein
VAVGQRGSRAVIVSAGNDRTVRVWDLKNLRQEKIIQVEATLLTVALTHDSRIAVGTNKGHMLLDWKSR